ncbi:hypothetical protein J1614_000936 [Plenodomus biglobosus]|nr:hypothetical protein J1614_000936 [Plenodomus biglobosus]
MNCAVYTPSPYWHYAGVSCYQSWYPIQNALTSPLEIRRLYAEQGFLENNFANCMTYLQVLRKKQDRIERRLSNDSAIPRKKRKQMQQTNRELKREILIREREQLTLLNNLQACKAKLYVVETLSSPSEGFLSSIPAFTSGSTRCTIPEDSEPTELNWNGWTDDAVMSPFAKRSNKPFFATEIAPEECSDKSIVEASVIDVDPHISLATMVEGLGISIPAASLEVVSPKASLSFLSPKAGIFEPRTISCMPGYDSVEERIDQPRIYKMELSHLTEAQSRRATDGVDPGCQPASTRFARSHTWCDNTPQASPTSYRQGKHINTRTRTNSM